MPVLVAAYLCPACQRLAAELVWAYGLQVCQECATEQAKLRIYEDQQLYLTELSPLTSKGHDHESI